MNLPIEQRHPIMCLTRDGGGAGPVEQARLLCEAGAKWVQLRMKDAAPEAWLATAKEVVGVCHAFGALCIVNDSVLIAIAAGADGAHLGRHDMDWHHARRMLGPRKILGGTVNDAEDARRAVASGSLDYAGVGPFRFTGTKKQLAPLLGAEGIARLVEALGGMPAWAIGGVQPADLPILRAAGASGVAVCGALYEGDSVHASYRAFERAWNNDFSI